MENKNNSNLKNTMYNVAEKYGEFCGNIFSGIINISGDFTATSLSLMNASYKGFKDTSQPAIDKFMDKCQQALDKNTNNINK
mgnify:CR=1 FL=1